NAAASGRVARRAMLVFVVLLSLFSGYAAVVAPTVLASVEPDPQLAASLQGGMVAAPAGGVPSLAQWIGNVVPTNAIMAAAQGAMLPLVVFALFFGFALTRIAAERRAQVIGLCQGIADAMRSEERRAGNERGARQAHGRPTTQRGSPALAPRHDAQRER